MDATKTGSAGKTTKEKKKGALPNLRLGPALGRERKNERRE